MPINFLHQVMLLLMVMVSWVISICSFAFTFECQTYNLFADRRPLPSKCCIVSRHLKVVILIRPESNSKLAKCLFLDRKTC